jgi:hypothetical protein
VTIDSLSPDVTVSKIVLKSLMVTRRDWISSKSFEDCWNVTETTPGKVVTKKIIEVKHSKIIEEVLEETFESCEFGEISSENVPPLKSSVVSGSISGFINLTV